VHLSCAETNTISKRIETSLHLHILPRSTIRCGQSYFHALGTFGANCAPILCRDENYLQTDRNELLLDPHHLGVQSSTAKMISDPMVCLAQTVHLSCNEFNILQIDRNKFPHGPHHVGAPSVAPKMIYDPMVCSVQTEHLYCTEINTIFKRTKTIFHLIYVT
jgi:hypothetical protein